MALEDSDLPKPYRLLHFTPLRYPGGKAKLADYVKALLKENRLLDGEYVEPYAGGAAIALAGNAIAARGYTAPVAGRAR